MKRKNAGLIAAFAFLLLVLGITAGVNLKQDLDERMRQSEKTAEEIAAWKELEELAERIDAVTEPEELAGLSSELLSPLVKTGLYQRGFLSGVTSRTEGFRAADGKNYLPAYPYRMMQKLCYWLGEGSIAEEDRREEALAIVRELNGELLLLCREVLASAGVRNGRLTLALSKELDERVTHAGQASADRLARWFYESAE